MRDVKKGSLDQSVTVRIVDAADGTPETGVVFNTSGIDLWYRREGAAKVSITEATLSVLTDAHSDGGILHVGDGYYRLDLPDAAVATGANGVLVGGAVTGMVVIGCYVPLVDYDPNATIESAVATALASYGVATISGIAAQQINIVSPFANGDLTIRRGDSYGTASGQTLVITKPSGAQWPTDLTTWTIKFTATKKTSNENTGTATIGPITCVHLVETGASQSFRIDLTAAQTAVALGVNGWVYDCQASSGSERNTVISSNMSVLEDVTTG